MQKPTDEEKRKCPTFSLDKYRAMRNQAKYYWNMSRCSYLELARYSRITPERARKWELSFIKERKRNDK